MRGGGKFYPKFGVYVPFTFVAVDCLGFFGWLVVFIVMQTCCICVLEVKNIKTFIRKLPPSFVGGRVSPRAKTLPFMEFGKHNEHESSDDIHHLPHVGNSTSQVSFLEGNFDKCHGFRWGNDIKT